PRIHGQAEGRDGTPSSDGIPGEDLAGANQGIEVVREHRKDALGDRFGRPAVRRMRGADRARLREEIDLVVAYAENLTGDGRACIAEKRGDERGDLFRHELLQS